MVEGQARKRQSKDVVGDCGSILQNISGSDTNGLNTLGFQPGIAPYIAFGVITHVMRHPIHLNHKPRVGTVKIHADSAAGMLPPKLHTLRLPAQRAPQQHFRQRHLLTQLPRAGNSAGGKLGRLILKHGPPLSILPELASGRWRTRSV